MNRRFLVLLLALLLCAAGLALAEEEAHTHDWGEFVVLTEPTCTSEGTEVRVCKICGATEVETLAMKDHSYEVWEYYSDEYHVRYCSVCGESDRQAHDTSIAKVVTGAQNNRLGKKNLTCAACGYNYTRLFSAYDRLYSMEGNDLLGNGTSYLKVNTISLPKDSERQLTLYSNGVFDLYAVTNTTLELYANVSGGEYRGLKLTGGEATLTVSGPNADLDFILISGGAKLKIGFKNGASSLALSSGEKEMTYLKSDKTADGSPFLSVSKSSFKGNTLSVNIKNYTSADGCFTLGPEGFAAYDGTLGESADFSYNGKTRTLTYSTQDGKFSVLSGSKRLPLNATSGILSENNVAFGWYAVLTSADGKRASVTPTYSLDGGIVSFPEGGTPAAGNDDTENTASAPADDGQSAGTSYLSASGTLSQTSGSSPAVSISYAENKLHVGVSALPKGYSVKRIQFVQTITGGPFTLKNVYDAEADFEVANNEGYVNVSVVLSDAKGNESTVFLASYEYKAE